MFTDRDYARALERPFTFENEHIKIGPRYTPERYPHLSISSSPCSPFFSPLRQRCFEPLRRFFNNVASGVSDSFSGSVFTIETLSFDLADLRHQFCDENRCEGDIQSSGIRNIWIMDITNLVEILKRNSTIKRVSLTIGDDEISHILLDPLYRFIRHAQPTQIERIFVNGQQVFYQTSYDNITKQYVIPYQPRIARACRPPPTEVQQIPRMRRPSPSPQRYRSQQDPQDEQLSNLIHSTVWNTSGDDASSSDGYDSTQDDLFDPLDDFNEL